MCVAISSGVALADQYEQFQPGAPGVGDPYFPLDGNGGYDVGHYLLDVRYAPATDQLTGVATITARATQSLSRFNLDFQGLTVRSITVNGKAATWSREGGELTVTPKKGLRKGTKYTTVVRYDGVPKTIEDPELGSSGVFHTDDGMVIIGEPDVAATWFPVNDHPSDKASFTFKVTVPKGLEAVANGALKDSETTGSWTAWTWHAKEPMAPYLATATVGEFDLNAYRKNGIRYWDAVDPDLSAPVAAPRTGQRLAISQVANQGYKRLTRTISVPAGGADLSFWITRDTEANWDYAFVEAHTVGQDDWTTLPDKNGHTSDATGRACPFWLSLHPFLAHYQKDNGDDTCTPKGTTGTWSAASGGSQGYEQWAVDLAPYAGKDVEVSITYASDDLVQLSGLFVDDVVVSTGAGTTSFEDDGNTLDGWAATGPPAGSEPNPNNWIAGTAADLPPPAGEVVKKSLARQPEIIGFLAEKFGPYPFSTSGGIVDDTDAFGFALENQTRPIYAKAFFRDSQSGDSVVVHELAHQWFGDSLAVARWQHIWLNEGFATYAEWLWSEREGLGTAQEIFDNGYSRPADSPFWQVKIGDPGAGSLFSGAVYDRGAMTLHQLRLAVGDEAFFTILRKWAKTRAGGNVTTDEFIQLAELVSGKQLDGLFQTWLFTAEKPTLPPGQAKSLGTKRVPPSARSLVQRHGGTLHSHG